MDIPDGHSVLHAQAVFGYSKFNAFWAITHTRFYLQTVQGRPKQDL